MTNSPARYQPAFQPAGARTQVSQATAIEQSRAIAEVQAAVLVAQQNRRSKPIAVEEMRDSTAQKSVADRAFFSFPRGGETVSGPSIHLARELARCWGNIQYGVAELRRDDDKGESEMQAFAWDLETNARNAITFIVPHKRDTKKGIRQLTEMRDIYENNANAGARRVREAIFAVLPAWFVEEASERCHATLQDGGGIPLATRVANSIGHFDGIGVSRKQLEFKIGRPSDEWTEQDLGELGITFNSIKNREITREEAFPPSRVTAADIESGRPTEAPAKDQPDERPAEDQPKDTEPTGPRPATAEELKGLTAALTKAGIKNAEERKAFLSAREGRDITAVKDLTSAEVASTIRFLETGEEQAGEPA
ncbi:MULTISPECIES: hypothetical protein [Rhodococcus]|uniref:hypothetical protein n=1 Tax=Rhodococcus TaxID=1827 RepID=UPI002955956D|nr:MULTISPECIES: hypothetical protein [Rhodococcus]MDV7244507.1 hypothetical protein [Rhodococcus oxybenzonivorans]MDV7274250.1 hypothetical protein [Rhodococcus oxybenzonivorans]MDV7337864.1 hypothetical protein [Rhodococcus oxybenzonivorans]MDV7345200.1 hypothetical protein [Rhodococcus oxybenzonivorans]MDV8028889.1 hypothetical protein [Rhodococcus sp. IEGM 27]